ncbi:MAG TPA: pantoate--beta-alanine ligase [Pseudolysinimonas sp.]|nr:pantoate--beta-alanine ligase [Pseudolysinimonas sp.]
MTRPVVVETIEQLRAALAGRRVAFVPTMGALHDGHLELVRRARELADTVVVSIFVNPLQFGAGEDLEKYPRTLDADLALLAPLDVAYVFAPSAAEMYPDGEPQVTVTGGPVAALFEGRSRPGHFDGMLTVVAKLLGIVRPEVAVFGQKDAQQLFLVQRLVRDLDIPTQIEPVDIVRADDGLALSSRNRYLGEEERIAARALSRALHAAAAASDRGLGESVTAAHAVLGGEALVKLDYLEVVDPRTFLPVDDEFRGPARVLIAARVGATRLIDTDTIYLN